MLATLSGGNSPPRTSSTPTCRPISAATAGLSPVSMTVCSPPAFNAPITWRLVARGASAMAKMEHTSSSCRTRTTVFPCAAKSSARWQTDGG